MESNIVENCEQKPILKQSIYFRYITVSSLRTGESINIGIIIEKEAEKPQIELVEKLETINRLFPIFDIEHINFCLKAIEVKYKKNRVKNAKVDISKVVSISSPKLYKVEANHISEIADTIFDKYVTIRKTRNYLISEMKKLANSYSKRDSEIIESEIDKNLIPNSEIDFEKHREKVKKELQNIKEQAPSERLKEILPKLEKALEESKDEEYHKILEEFRDSEDNIAKDVAKSYYLEALGYYNRVEYQKALDYIYRAVILDENSSLYLNDYANYLTEIKGEYDKAIEYYEKALKIDLKNFGENYSSVAIRYNNLGGVYNSKGEYDKAIEFYEKALEIDLKNFDENHSNVAIRYNNLGTAHDDKGEYKKAIEYYEKAVNIDLKNFDENHPQIATYYNNLGGAYKNKSEYDKAIEYYEKALKIFINVFKDENHPYIKIVKRNLKLAKEALRDSKSN